jgi:predicted 3-demethylubiquinone-9 3-methyltransferase (glyoxalase superfamily)
VHHAACSVAKSGRAMQAMMGMKKLDLTKLQTAFDGL